MKLEADNYQILSDVELDDEGLIFLIGSNDQGKSSLIRAVRSLLYNDISDSLIQQGESEAVVKLEKGGDEITWNRSNSDGSVYTINGEKYTKPGRGAFERVTGLGFSKLTAGPDDISLNIWDQFSPFLLLNRPDTRKFQVLSKIFEADKFDDLLKNINDDKKELQSEVDEKTVVLNELEDECDTIQERKDIRENFLSENEERIEFISNTSEKIEKVDELIERRSTLKEHLNGLRDKLELAKNRVEALEAKQEEIDTVLEVYNLFSKWIDISEQVEQAKSVVDTLEEYDFDDRISRITKAKNVLEQCVRYFSLKDDISDLRSVVSLFDDCDFPVDDIQEQVERYKNLLDIVEKRSDIQESLNEFVTEHEECSNEKIETEELVEDLKSEMGICPVCESEFS